MTKTILVVDDEKRLRDMLQAYLNQEGFRVGTAADGQQALFVARHEKPDLIIVNKVLYWSTISLLFLRLTGKKVILLPDNDVQGKEHMAKVGASLDGKTANLKLLELPDLPSKGDVSDFIESFKS